MKLTDRYQIYWLKTWVVVIEAILEMDPKYFPILETNSCLCSGAPRLKCRASSGHEPVKSKIRLIPTISTLILQVNVIKISMNAYLLMSALNVILCNIKFMRGLTILSSIFSSFTFRPRSCSRKMLPTL